MVFEAGFDVYELVVEFSFVFAMVLSSPSLVDVFCSVAGVGAFSLITGCFERYLNRMFMLTAARLSHRVFTGEYAVYLRNWREAETILNPPRAPR